MSRLGLTYDGGGNVTGFVFCSQDDDLALQEQATVQVAADHDATTNPTGWEIFISGGLPAVRVR